MGLGSPLLERIPMSTSAPRAAARLTVLLAALAAMLLALLQAPSPAHAGPGEGDITTMINSERARVGAAPLATRSDLVQVARAWSERMARESRLYHNPSLKTQVCCWATIGENVAWSTKGAADVHARFMSSPPHRANVLSTGFTEVGVGSARDSRGRLWVTEVFRRPTVGAQAPPSAIDQHHRNLGGTASPLGSAVTGELAARDGVGRLKRYVGGVIYWTPATGARSVRGTILTRWAGQNSELGPLRYPTTDELPAPDRVGRFNHFQGGSIYWTPRTGAHEVRGAIHGRWRATGWELGALRYPTTGERGTPDGVGRYNHFQGGSIYWTPRTGAHEVRGAIHGAWRAQGWENGRLGYPVSGEYDIPGGRASSFQRGQITWDRATGVTRVVLR
jgi:uncharacterized protein YkwD